MNFGYKPHQDITKNLNKIDIAKSFKKVESQAEKKTRKISKKPYKILEA